MVLKIWLALFIIFLVYSGFVYTQGDKPTACVPNNEVHKGWWIWQEKNCQSCHQLYGLGGYMGPDLTNVYSAENKGPEYMKGFIKYGTGRMPNYQLNDEEVTAVISFLAWVDDSGKSAVPASSVHWTGTYIMDE